MEAGTTTLLIGMLYPKTIPATELYLYDNIKNLELLPNCEEVTNFSR